MKQTYQEFLEESTYMVKAKRNLSRVIILSTYFAVWITVMVLCCGSSYYISYSLLYTICFSERTGNWYFYI